MAVEVKGLRKEIKGRVIYDGIDIHAPSSCVTGLAGVNGSGKTMLMRSIAGLIKPDKGSIAVDGQTLGPDIEFPPSIGVLIENPAFLNGRSGFENLSLLASIRSIADGERIRKVIEFVGLNPTDKRHFSKYSLGMKQRLGLAAAIMERPRLLLLDEPTNALDSEGIAMLKSLVRDSKIGGATVILACHDASILRELSDQIYYLAEGHVDGHECLRDAGSL